MSALLVNNYMYSHVDIGILHERLVILQSCFKRVEFVAVVDRKHLQLIGASRTAAGARQCVLQQTKAHL